MSQMTITCPHCSQEVLGDTAYGGQTLACPSCGGEFVMPGEPESQSHAHAATHVAPPPQLTRAGRPQLKRSGIAVRPGPVVGAAHQRRTHSASQQLAAGGHHVPGTTSGLLYQERPGFGKLWADPVTGQREACDGMGPGKSLVLGLVFLFAVPLLAYLLTISNLLQIPGLASPGARAIEMPAKAHILIFLTFLGMSALVALFAWLFRLMCAKRGTFGEILLVSGMALFWLFAFVFLGILFAKMHPIAGGFVMVFGASAFFSILYGIFRNLGGASGAASFWLAPLSLATTFLTFNGYMWFLGKIFS